MKTSARKPAWSIRALLAGGVLFFVVRLSAGDRGSVDYVVIALLLGAILWNIVRLARRLHAHHGGRAVWDVLRTAAFWTVGALNTIGARPEDVGSWRTWVGLGVFAIAVFDSSRLVRREREAICAEELTHGDAAAPG